MIYKDKQFRNELKYYISYSEYMSFKGRLKAIMERDPFALSNGNYHIRSLYFDDIYDSALHDKNFGISRREKYRVRIYNKDDSYIRMERKTKYDQYVCKEWGVLSRSQYEKIMKDDVDFLLYMGNEVLKDFYVKFKSDVLRPKVIVDYEREAYIFKVGGVRITFDKNLCAGVNSNHIFCQNLVTVNAFKDPILILEVKYNDFLPGNIKGLLHISRCENSAISKYGICRVLKDSIKQG